MSRRLSLGLDAVIVAVTADQPRILTANQPRDGVPALPSGLLDADGDATLELGLRRWISAQTGLSVGYVEQLYTFGDRDRQRTADGTRHLSVAYLGLVREAQPAPGAAWLDGYSLLPWEDRRAGMPAIVSRELLPALSQWAGRDAARKHRVHANFGDRRSWDPIRVLERFELLYEAELVPEFQRDRGRRSRHRALARHRARRRPSAHRRDGARAAAGQAEVPPGRVRAPARDLHPAAAPAHRGGADRHAAAQAEFPAPGRKRPLPGGHPGRKRAARGRPAKLFRFRKEVVRTRLY